MTKQSVGSLPAFPCSYWATPESDQPSFHNGMGLRDFFAAQALTGLITRRPSPVDEIAYRGIVATAYALADAMLIERERSGKAE